MLRQNLGGWVGIFKNDCRTGIDSLHFSSERILRIQRHGVIKTVNKLTSRKLEGLEIHHHIVLVQGLRRDDDFNPTTMPMRETTSLGMLAEHMARFDSKSATDAVARHLLSVSG